MTACNNLSKKNLNWIKISGRTARILKLAGFHLWMYNVYEQKIFCSLGWNFFFLFIVKDTFGI